MGISSRTSARRDPARLLGLLRFSTRMVWTAARLSFCFLVALQLLAGGILAAQVLAVGWVLNGILSLDEGRVGVVAVLWPVALLALLTATSAVLGSVKGSLSRYVGESVARLMWQELLQVSTMVGLRAYESPEFFDRLERVRGNALLRPFQVTNGLVSVVGAVAAGVGVAITLATFNPVLLPLLLVGGVPVLITSRWESRLEFRFTLAQTEPIRHRQYLSMILTGRNEAKEVRAFEVGPTLRQRFDRLYDRYLDDLRGHLRRRTLLSLVGQLAAALMLTVTLFVLVWLISTGDLTVAEAGAALVAVRMLATQVQTLAGAAQSIFESGLFIDDLRTFLALRPQDAVVRAEPLDFHLIEAHGVHFTYPGRTTPAVADVTIRIDRGDVVALVGENGSGKTTLAKLVAGLYPVDEGSITWDGASTEDLPRGTVIASTAVIFQDFVRYAMDASSNIALGRVDDEPDHERVGAAARTAGAADFIETLPQGYASMLTRMFEGGADLSGGQWQRVAIARALYRDAPLVVLDEPTAALDARAEADLVSSLRQTMVGHSALVISHRFSTVRSADRIYVMHDGRIQESGTHEELMARDGRYAEMFRLQAASYLPGMEGSR